MDDSDNDISSYPTLIISKRTSGDKTKFTARIRNPNSKEVDTLGTFDTREEAQEEYERQRSDYQIRSQPFSTPDSSNKRRRSAAQINVDCIKDHDGMTDSIFKDYISSSFANTPTTEQRSSQPSMFEDEDAFEHFETPLKAQSPKTRKDLHHPPVDNVFELGPSITLNPNLARVLGNFLTTHRRRPDIMALTAVQRHQWEIILSVTYAEALATVRSTLLIPDELYHGIRIFLSFAANLNDASLILLDDLVRKFRQYCHNMKGVSEETLKSLIHFLSRPEAGGAGAPKKITWLDATNAIIRAYDALPDDIMGELKPFIRIFHADDDTYATVTSPTCVFQLTLTTCADIIPAVRSLSFANTTDDGNDLNNLLIYAVLDALVIAFSSSEMTKVNDPSILTAMSSRDARLLSIVEKGDARIYEVNIHLEERATHSVLHAVQIAAAAILSMQRIKAGENLQSFKDIVLCDLLTLLALKITISAVTESEVASSREIISSYSISSLNEQAAYIVDKCSDLAEPFLAHTLRTDDASLTFENLGKLFTNGYFDGDGDIDTTSAKNCLIAFGGDSELQIGKGLLKLCQLRRIHTASSENNRMVALYTAIQYAFNSEKLTFRIFQQRCGDTFSPSVADNIMAESVKLNHEILLRHTKNGGHSSSATDNATPTSKNKGTELIGKKSKETAGSVAFTVFPKTGYKPFGTSSLPETPDHDTGLSFLKSLPPVEFTLDGIDRLAGVSRRSILVESLRKLRIIKLRKSMLRLLSRDTNREEGGAFFGFTLPQISASEKLDLDKEAADLFPGIQLSAPMQHIDHPFRDLDPSSLLNACRIHYQMLQYIGVDVEKTTERLIFGKDDSLKILIFGDQKTQSTNDGSQRRCLKAMADLKAGGVTAEDVRSDVKLYNQIFIALTTLCSYSRPGGLHGRFAHTDLQTKLFDSIIYFPIRSTYEEFRTLNHLNFKVSEWDLWEKLLLLVKGAEMDVATEDFLLSTSSDIINATSMTEIEALFNRHQRRVIFDDVDYVSGEKVDIPCLQLFADLLLHDISDLLGLAEQAGYEPLFTACHVFNMALYKAVGKTQYTIWALNLVSFEKIASSEMVHFSHSHAHFSQHGLKAQQAMDRHCEKKVEASKEGGASCTSVVNRRAVLMSITAYFRSLGSSMAHISSRKANGRKYNSRIPSIRAIATDLLLGLRARNQGSPQRNYLRSFVSPFAGQRVCKLPFAYLEQLLVFADEGQLRLTTYAFENQDVDINRRRSLLPVDCVGCGNPFLNCDNAVVIGDVDASSVGSSSDTSDDDTEVTDFECQACNLHGQEVSFSMKCNVCFKGLCLSCATDPDTRHLSELKVTELKSRLKSMLAAFPGERMRARNKIDLIRRIRELQEIRRLNELRKRMPVEACDSIGDTPPLGAVLLRIGQKYFTDVIGPSVATPLGSVPGRAGVLTPEEVFEPAEEVEFDENGNFEVQINCHVPVGSALGFEIAKIDEQLRALNVQEDSEAYRTGIRSGDEILHVAGQPNARKAEEILHLLKGRPAYLRLRRQNKDLPQETEKYKRPANGLVTIAYFSHGLEGDRYQHSTEQLSRWSPHARYLRQEREANRVIPLSEIDLGMAKIFLAEDTDAFARDQSAFNNKRTKVDAMASKKLIRGVERTWISCLPGSGLELLTGFVGGGESALKLHQDASLKYVRDVFIPSLEEPAETEKVAFEFLESVFGAVKDSAFKASSTTTSDRSSDHDDDAVLASLAEMKLREAQNMESVRIKSKMHFRSSTPESVARQAKLLVESRRLCREADAAVKAMNGAQEALRSPATASTCDATAPLINAIDAAIVDVCGDDA